MKQKMQNRHGLQIVMEVEGDIDSSKLVFVIHGLSGSKDQPHMLGMREAFTEAGYCVVAFDATHSFGESEGDLMHATATSFISDLEDVIAWAETQAWYKEPFTLAGHSLGGISLLVYASKHPNKITALLPMSTVVSGKIRMESKDPVFLKEWKEKGYYHKVSKSLPGKSGNISYKLNDDLLQYDTLAFAANIHCPILLLVGSEDDTTTPAMQQMLYDRLGGPKELHIINGMPHSPREPQHLDKIKKVTKNWLAGLH